MTFKNYYSLSNLNSDTGADIHFDQQIINQNIQITLDSQFLRRRQGAIIIYGGMDLFESSSMELDTLANFKLYDSVVISLVYAYSMRQEFEEKHTNSSISEPQVFFQWIVKRSCSLLYAKSFRNSQRKVRVQLKSLLEN